MIGAPPDRVQHSLAGRVAVVTGASSGIGLATATMWGWYLASDESSYMTGSEPVIDGEALAQ